MLTDQRRTQNNNQLPLNWLYDGLLVESVAGQDEHKNTIK